MADGSGPHLSRLDLADYRRRTSEIYAEVRRLGVGAQAHAFWRQARDELFRTHPSSALSAAARASFAGLPYGHYDPRLHVLGDVDLDGDAPAGVAPPASGSSPIVRIGTVRFDLLGASHALDLFWFDDYAGGLFLPFRDATSGTTTYGGGRYLLDGAKSADLGAVNGRLVLDFNFAYHPSCVHDPQWTCPLAPPQNRLPVRVEGGEVLPSG